ncbi:MAG: hypothetical protein AB7K24_21375 [Gemmataceae bacterium]
MNNDLLVNAYTQYHQSKLDFNAGREFSQILQRAGLFDESLALELYFRSENESVFAFQREPWTNRRCVVSLTPPVNAQFGDLWLDPVEVNVAVFVPNRPESSQQGIGWISRHPVQVWQFCTFLKLVRKGASRTEFPFPTDYLSSERFQGLSSTLFATNVYHDEAIAYAVWFGKWLTSRLDLGNARRYLRAEEFRDLLPENMRLWDGSLDREELRLAIGRDCLEKLPEDDIQMLLRGEKLPQPDRMVYGEWERSPSIGFSSVVHSALTIDRLKKSYTSYFDLENTALNLSEEQA